MSSTSKSLLQRACQGGNASAWEQLSRVYEPLVKDWLHRLSAPAADVDDLVQEVLIVVMRKLPTFEHNSRKGAFRNWLRNITFNCLRDLWKQQRFCPKSEGGSDFRAVLDQFQDPKSELSETWSREHDEFVTAAILRQIRNDFKPESWEAFELITLHGKTADEVASMLGTNRNAIYAAKSRIMSRLRQEVEGIVD